MGALRIVLTLALLLAAPLALAADPLSIPAITLGTPAPVRSLQQPVGDGSRRFGQCGIGGRLNIQYRLQVVRLQRPKQ